MSERFERSERPCSGSRPLSRVWIAPLRPFSGKQHQIGRPCPKAKRALEGVRRRLHQEVCLQRSAPYLSSR
jgi:hypothetical protein